MSFTPAGPLSHRPHEQAIYPHGRRRDRLRMGRFLLPPSSSSGRFRTHPSGWSGCELDDVRVAHRQSFVGSPILPLRRCSGSSFLLIGGAHPPPGARAGPGALSWIARGAPRRGLTRRTGPTHRHAVEPRRSCSRPSAWRARRRRRRLPAPSLGRGPLIITPLVVVVGMIVPYYPTAPHRHGAPRRRLRVGDGSRSLHRPSPPPPDASGPPDRSQGGDVVVVSAPRVCERQPSGRLPRSPSRPSRSPPPRARDVFRERVAHLDEVRRCRPKPRLRTARPS